MYKKFSLILLLFCLIIVGIGSVSATEFIECSYDLNDTNYQNSSSIDMDCPHDTINVETSFNEINKESVFNKFQGNSSLKENNTSVSPEMGSEALNTSAVVYFTGFKSSELQKQIETLNNGDILVFEHDVQLDITNIPIRKSITLDGNFHSIGGMSICRIFEVFTNNVVLRNFNFYDISIAVTWHGHRGTIEGCTFKKNPYPLEWEGKDGTLRNCTFMNNNGWNPILISGSNTTIVGCTFKNNNGGDGSGLYISGSNCCVDGCTFEKNSASRLSTIYVQGDNLCVKNSIFNENCGKYAGSIYISAKNCNVETCIFKDNSASYAGAIYYAKGDNCKINGCTFTGNHAYQGGSVFISRGECCVKGCTFQNNTAENRGGAIYICVDGDKSQVVNCTLKENIAPKGGAIYTRAENFVVDGCKFEKNQADYGGGIFVDMGKGFIENSEFYSNTAVAEGAAIFFSGFAKLTQVVCCDFYKNHGNSVISATHDLVPDYYTVVTYFYIGKCTFYLNDAKRTIVTFDRVDIENCAFYKNTGIDICDIDTYRETNVEKCWFGNTKSDHSHIPKLEGKVIMYDWYELNDDFTTSNAQLFEKVWFVKTVTTVENCDLRINRDLLCKLIYEDAAGSLSKTTNICY